MERPKLPRVWSADANINAGKARVSEPKHMRLSNWMIGLVVAVLFAGTWVLLNRPVEQDPWTQDVSGLTYTPFRDNANPTNGKEPTLAEVRRDLSLMAGLTSQIRTYSTVGANYGVPTMADKMGLRVMAGAWIDVDPKRNRQEIDNLVALATNNGSVSRVTVGNEAIYKNLVKVPQLIEYIREVKRRLPGIPVSTAEPYGVWLDHPELLDEVDFVAVHILPFWNGIPVEDAVAWTLGNYQAVKNEVKRRGLDKRVVLTEVGWPSQGLQRMGADRLAGQPGHLPAQLRARGEEAGHRVFHHRRLRPAVEGGVRRRRRRLLGRVGRPPQPEARAAGHPGQLPELALAGRRHAGARPALRAVDAARRNWAWSGRGRFFLALLGAERRDDRGVGLCHL